MVNVYVAVLEAAEKPLRSVFQASPRKLLFLTCLVMFLVSVIMVMFSAYMCTLFYDPGSANAAWLNFLGLCVVGVLLGFVCLLGMRGAHIVTLDYILYYFWLTVVLIAPLALGCFICFDFIIYMNLWFLHSWDQPAFEQVRVIFCEPGTANTLCVAPVQGGKNYNNTELWCLALYNATTCESVKNAAQSEAQSWGRLLMLVEAIVTVSNIGLILFSLYLCYRILTIPVLTESMNDIMNFLLLLPAIACSYVADYTWWMRHYNVPFYWLADIFLGFGILQFSMLPLGIIAGRMKSQNLMAVYIFMATLITCGLGTAGVVCILVAGFIPDNYGITT